MDNILNNPDLMSAAQNILKNPDMVKNVMNMMKDPNVMNMMKDPNVMNMLNDENTMNNLTKMMGNMNNETSNESNESNESNDSNKNISTEFNVDDIVLLKNLKNEEYNNKNGKIIEINYEKERYIIMMDNEKKISVKYSCCSKIDDNNSYNHIDEVD